MDEIKKKRIILFLGGCMLARIYLVYLAKNYPQYLPILGKIALLIGFGFLYIYFTGSRKTGPEVFGDKIWWGEIRPVHGFLYLLFSIYALQGKTFAWKVLLVDVIFGLSVFLLHHKLI